MIIRLIERFCPSFNIKTFQIIVGIITTILLVTVLMLGWLSSKEVKKVVTEDFNQQQLLLAQHAARQIENNMNSLKRELSLLSLSPSMQYFEKVFMGKRMAITFSSIKDEGALEIRYIESVRPLTHLVNSRGYQNIRTYSDNMHYLKWAAQVKNKGSIVMSEILEKGNENENENGFLAMQMVIPVWQTSVDEAHPAATNKFTGVLIFVIDATRLIEKITKEIRSGKTGYAWVIDKNGTFLYHPEKDFIGKNAFEARKERAPAISFARINEIQKEKMLAGKEGTSWYISGWHGGRESEMNKLIAYSPIRLLLDKGGEQIWSVAVVAPVSEVEGAIHSVQVRQFLLEGIAVLVILLSSATIIFLILRWSSSLSEEVKKKTGELTKSENQYRSLIENANDIIFAVDKNGDITSINRAGCLFFDRTKEEIMGRNIGEICFNEESAGLQFQAIDEVFHKKISRLITYPVNIKGKEYWISTNFSVLMDEKGNPYAALGIARDITSDKKRALEEQMYHTEKLASMGTLAAGVAHEINNPLALILGFSDMLVEKAKPDSNEYDILRTIEKHALNAKKVVENLLSFARYTEHKEEFIDINANIETVLAVVENTLKLNNISLNRRLRDNLPKVRADAGEVQQVFLNMINNAIHAMKGGGALTVTTELSDNELVELRFADTGHGIKKEHRTKIFDPLFTTKKIGEGTGLGLSVSYGIVTKHGGTITFETKTKEDSEETGTTFIITLPAIKTVDKGDG